MNIVFHNKSLTFLLAFMIVLLILFSSLFGVLQFEFSKRSFPTAEKGVLDLSSWSFANDGVIELNGEWEFYWGQLLTPEDFIHSPNKPNMTGYINILSDWVGTLGDTKLTGMGSGTYRLVIKNTPKDSDLALKKSVIRTSSAIFVNGKKVIRDGQPAENKSEYLFSNIPRLGFFNVDTADLEIIVQVSNYDYIIGGIVSPLLLGEPQAILEQSNRRSIFEFMIVGINITIGLICFLSYFLISNYKREKKLLSFAIFCFFCALTNSMYGERTFLILFPRIPFEIAYKILQFSLLATIGSIAVFINRLNTQILTLSLRNIILGLVSGLALTLILLPLSVYAYLGVLMGVIGVIFYIGILIRAVYIFLIKGNEKREKKSYIFLICALIVLNLYMISLTTYSLGLTKDMFLGFIFSLIFAVMLMVYLAGQISSLYSENWQISLKLALQEKESLEREYAFLRSQIKPHFLYNALNTIVSYCYIDGQRAGELLRSFSYYLRGSFDYEHSNGMISIEQEMMMVHGYVNIQKARFGDRISVNFEIEPDLLQFQVPALSIQPLVENAVRHGVIKKEHGGTVKIAIYRRANQIIIEVTDDGVGIPDQQINRILNDEGNNGLGRGSLGGVGLYNVQKRLKHILGTTLKIESIEGVGTKVSFEMDESKLSLGLTDSAAKDSFAKGREMGC